MHQECGYIPCLHFLVAQQIQGIANESSCLLGLFYMKPKSMVREMQYYFLPAEYIYIYSKE